MYRWCTDFKWWPSVAMWKNQRIYHMYILKKSWCVLLTSSCKHDQLGYLEFIPLLGHFLWYFESYPNKNVIEPSKRPSGGQGFAQKWPCYTFLRPWHDKTNRWVLFSHNVSSGNQTWQWWFSWLETSIQFGNFPLPGLITTAMAMYQL